MQDLPAVPKAHHHAGHPQRIPGPAARALPVLTIHSVEAAPAHVAVHLPSILLQAEAVAALIAAAVLQARLAAAPTAAAPGVPLRLLPLPQEVTRQAVAARVPRVEAILPVVAALLVAVEAVEVAAVEDNLM